MEKLNELVKALYPQYGAPGSRDVDITARRKAIDESTASIAEAFRELEQRAEAAEAELAELAKEEPIYLYREHNLNNGMVTSWEEVDRESYEHLKTITDPETAEFREIFTRPAPAAVPVDVVPECSWTYDENDYFWSSSCGEDWQFTNGGPEENHVKFCQGCGGVVRVGLTK